MRAAHAGRYSWAGTASRASVPPIGVQPRARMRGPGGVARSRRFREVAERWPRRLARISPSGGSTSRSGPWGRSGRGPLPPPPSGGPSSPASSLASNRRTQRRRPTKTRLPSSDSPSIGRVSVGTTARIEAIGHIFPRVPLDLPLRTPSTVGHDGISRDHCAADRSHRRPPDRCHLDQRAGPLAQEHQAAPVRALPSTSRETLETADTLTHGD